MENAVIIHNGPWLDVFSKSLGLSQTDLKEIAGVSGSKTVRRWTSGESTVPADLIEALELLADDMAAITDALLAGWQEAGRPDEIIMVVYTELGRGGAISANDLVRKYGQPLPARGCAGGGFAGLHRLAVFDAACEIADSGAEVTLVRFDPADFNRWCAIQSTRKLSWTVAEWAAAKKMK